MMELNQLIQFKTIAECETMTQAAEKLHISQPALSTMLKKLEEELGVFLFDRKKNKVSLNVAGKLALTHANEILSKVDKMKTDLSQFSRKDKIFTIGFCDPGSLWYCTPRFSMIHPDIELKTNLYEESENDVLISSKKINYPSINSESFIEEQLLLSVPHTSSLAGLSQISLREEKLPPMVLFFVAGSFFQKQKPFYKEIELKTKMTSDYFVFNQMIHNTETATITTRLVQHYRNDGVGRVLIPIVDPETFIHYHVSYMKRNKTRLDAFLAWTEFCANSFE